VEEGGLKSVVPIGKDMATGDFIFPIIPSSKLGFRANFGLKT